MGEAGEEKICDFEYIFCLILSATICLAAAVFGLMQFFMGFSGITSAHLFTVLCPRWGQPAVV